MRNRVAKSRPCPTPTVGAGHARRSVYRSPWLACIAAFLCLAPLTSAAGIEGKWSAEFQASGKKAKAAAPATLNLSSDGKQVTGSVGAGKRAMTIQEGKVDGASFSFVTVRKGKKGEARMLWSGTLEGDTISGTRSREGGKQRATFVAKRST